MSQSAVRALSSLTARVMGLVPVLAVAGHGVDPRKTPDVVERARKLLDSPRARNRAVGSYLDFHGPAMEAMGLDPSDASDVVRHLHMPRCGLPDILPFGASQCRWRHEPVTAALGKGWEAQKLFTPQQVRAAIEWSNARWCAVGGSVWKWHEKGDPGPNQLIHHVPIDGPSNVLADQVLPCNVGRDTECRMRLDSGEFGRGGLYERYGYEYFRAVVTHEDGHKWGHDHSRDPKALMYPSARPEVLDLGGDDAGRHRATYGAPRQKPPPPPPRGPVVRGVVGLRGTLVGIVRGLPPGKAGDQWDIPGGWFQGDIDIRFLDQATPAPGAAAPGLPGPPADLFAPDRGEPPA